MLMDPSSWKMAALESIAPGSTHRGSHNCDPRGQSSLKAGNLTRQHRLSGTGFPVMKKWRIERVHRVLFQSFTELPRTCDGWNPCENKKLWRWSPSCKEKPGMLEGPEPWFVCVRQLHAQQRGCLCYEKKHWRGRSNCRSSVEPTLFHHNSRYQT